MVSEKIFQVCFHYKSMGANEHQGMANMDPRGMVGRIYVGDPSTLLYTKYLSSGPYGFREEDFLSFSHYKSMGAIYRHGGHVDLRTAPFLYKFSIPLNTKLHMKFEDIWPGVSEEKSFKGVNRWTDGWTDRQTDRRRRVITIAYPEP